jgi:UDP-GlcNAc:undecaprenyl-phosphate GlcNAc-1-phosphate transferase
LRHPVRLGHAVRHDPLHEQDHRLGLWGIAFTIVWVGRRQCDQLIDGLAAGRARRYRRDDAAAGGFRRATSSVSLAAALVGSAWVCGTTSARRIIMGDSGSMFLGFVLGPFGHGPYKSYTAISLVILLALGVPITDTAFAIMRRWRSGRSIYLPDRTPTTGCSTAG